MKRGLILLFIILLLYLVNAQNDELRIRVDGKNLGPEVLVINLTEFFGVRLNYFLITKPEFVNVRIFPDLGLAKITSLKGKNGTDILIFTYNKTKENTIKEIKFDKDIKTEVIKKINVNLNKTLDKNLQKALEDTIKNFTSNKYELGYVTATFLDGILDINLDNKTKLNLVLKKYGDNVVISESDIDFEAENEDNNYLFYEKRKTNYSYILRKNINFISGIFFFVLIVLLILIYMRKDKSVSKEDFKKAYLNKISILKRIVYKEDSELDKLFEEFTNDMRSFFSHVLKIKYKFTYNELINELIIKKVDDKLKNDIVKFAKDMLDKSYREKINKKDLINLIESGKNIIERF